MNASVAIQTLPEAKNDEELIRIVDEVIAYIKSTGLNYYVGPFETAIEGDYDELMDIVKECQHIAIRAGAPSVAAYIKVTYKPEGDVLTIEKKVTKHHKQGVFSRGNCSFAARMADTVKYRNRAVIFAAVPGRSSASFCERFSTFDGTCKSDIVGRFFRLGFGSDNRICCGSFDGSFSRVLQSVLSDYGNHTDDTDDCDCSASCAVDGI